MPEVISNTSPLQYLHQLDALTLLHTLATTIIVPPAVVDELVAGRQLGVDLPDVAALDWVTVRQPRSVSALPLVSDLGPGEAEVLMLALESPGAVAILDDALARRTAQAVGVKFTGTLGILLDAKRAGLIPQVEPLLNRLQALSFRLAPHTRRAVLLHAGETA